MDDNNYNVRIDDNFLRADFADGQVLQHTDLNEFESVVKLAVNANYEDIQKLQDGTIQAGGAATLSGAELSTYETETLQNSDTKIPTSMQTKQYVDASVGAINLSGYATKNEVSTIVATYDSTGNGIVDNAEKVNNHTVDKDVPSNAVFTDTVYDDTEVRGLIQTNTNNISSINTNLTNNYVTNTSLASTLTSYVKPADYATSSKGGTVKVSDTYGSYIVSGGALACKNLTFANYGSASNNLFVSKGTLENVITGKNLANKTYVDTGLAAKQGTLTAGSNITINGNTISATDTTYSNATTSTAGLMSAADKTKLDSINASLVGTQASPIDLTTLSPGVYKIQGYVVYQKTQNNMNLITQIAQLENAETFIVSNWVSSVKRRYMDLSSSYDSYDIDDFTEKQILWVDRCKVIILQRRAVGTTGRFWNHQMYVLDLNQKYDEPILVWENTTSDLDTNFAEQTITIGQDYIKLPIDADNDGYFKMFVEIIYTEYMENDYAPTVCKSTGKINLPLISATQQNITQLTFDDIDFSGDNAGYLTHYLRRVYMGYTNNGLSIEFSDCAKLGYNKNFNDNSNIPTDNTRCIPLYIYVYVDNNKYWDRREAQ